MKKTLHFICLLLVGSGVFYSCQDDQDVDASLDVSDAVRSQLIGLGFDVINQAPIKFDQGYLVEGDIYLTPADLATMKQGNRIPTLEQYRTTNLVNAGGGRVIKIYAPVGGSTGYSAGMIAGLDLAISRYNAQNLLITFQRTTTSTGADIVMTRLSKGDERRGVLGSAGFPTSSGNPYNQIKMSGILESTYNLSTGGIATIIGHEMGHCIGFRHTDYFDRSVSCGGAKADEGASTVGAVHIVGTPTGATLSDKSWMLACTDGGDRPFNNDDRTALNTLY
jgi:Dual-action HEIGH metallo-peptidase